ncbi:MAG: DUF3987 domain-containing protein, partial [Planctomycetes bacterium]|nr:DUF3987 domain-containing protein [Planctomycetota bacterium]
GCTWQDWDHWSKRCSDKYQPYICERKWQTFGVKSNGLGLGSLVQWAAHDSGYGKKELLDRINPQKHSDTSSPAPEPWPSLMPLGEPPAPDFPLNTLPGLLQKYVECVATALEVPADMPAITALAVLGMAGGGRYVVHPKPDWREPVNLYTVIVSPPGTRKSAVHSEITKTLVETEEIMRNAAA